MTPQVFTSQLQRLLRDCGMPDGQAAKFTTHCFRRGAGTDVLEAQPLACEALGGTGWLSSASYGLGGMLRMGEWVATSSLAHYATQDEQASASMAFHILEASDDEA